MRWKESNNLTDLVVEDQDLVVQVVVAVLVLLDLEKIQEDQDLVLKDPLVKKENEGQDQDFQRHEEKRDNILIAVLEQDLIIVRQ